MPNLTSLSKRKLLGWFDGHARALPWRRNRDPYRIWVSEVMLQQTTVATVAPRFEQFLTAFPNVQALARASEQAVLKVWESLGYYSRARNLHKAARMLVDAHDSRLPDDPEVWAALPGVGRYILGAVLSQAFDRRMPIVEANTKRVLCRLFAQAGDLKSGAVQTWLWETATEILPHKRVGDFNQALMELGALVCTPDEPNCPDCPLQRECVARRMGLERMIPRQAERPALELVREVCIVPRNGGKVLLVRRPASGRWANMWEFPHAAIEGSETLDTAAQKLIDSLGLIAKPSGELMTIRYSVTRFRMVMICIDAIARTKSLQLGYHVEGRWLRPAELDQFPVSSPQRKLAALLGKPISRGLF